MEVKAAAIRPHSFDPLRFDVVVNDQMFYVRAQTQAERDDWVQALRETKVGTDVGGMGRLVLMLCPLVYAIRWQRLAAAAPLVAVPDVGCVVPILARHHLPKGV